MSSCTSAPTLNRRTTFRLGSVGLAAALSTLAPRSAEAQSLVTLESNKARVHRLFEEAVNGGNEAAIGELYAPDFVDQGTWARHMPGPAGMPLTLATFHARFPDATVGIDAVIAEDDRVAALVTWRGAHPPAGTHLMGQTMHLFRIANGQIIEEWSAGWDWIARLEGRREPPPTNPLMGP